MIGVMFLIAVVSIVEGMSRVRRERLRRRVDRREHLHAAALAELQAARGRRPDWRELLRRPRLYARDARASCARRSAGGHQRRRSSRETFLYATTARRAPAAGAGGRHRGVATSRSRSSSSSRAAPSPTQEVRAGSRVVVIGTEVADHFFKGLDPLGRELRIAGVPYTRDRRDRGAGLGVRLLPRPAGHRAAHLTARRSASSVPRVTSAP